MAAGLPRDAAHSQLASAIDVVVHLGRGRDGRRRLREVGVVRRTPAGWVEVDPAVTLTDDGGLTEGPSAGTLADLLARGGGS